MAELQKKPIKQARSLRKTMTRAEQIVWRALRAKQLGGFKFRRQHPIGRYIADFACVSAKLVLEIDGDTHSTDSEMAHDAKRAAYLES